MSSAPESQGGPSRRGYAAVLGFALLACVLLLAYTFRPADDVLSPSSLEKRLSDPAFMRALEIRDAGFRDSLALYLLTAHSAIEKKHKRPVKGVRINKPLDADYINIYFVKMETIDWLRPYRGTCTYTGVKHTILCDVAFIDWMQSAPPPTPLTKEDKEFEQFVRAENSEVLLWLLGHELGHLAHGHGARHFTGQIAMRQHNYLDGFRAAKEVDADRFAFELGEEAGWTPDRGQMLGLMLFRGLHGFINKLGNTILSDNQRVGPLVSYKGRIPIRAGSMRDALFARAVNMAITINEKYKFETPGYYESLRDRIEIIH